MMLKVHVALKVANLVRSVNFYQNLFGVLPIKHKLDYAKFDVDVPALNLTLNQRSLAEPFSPEADGTLSHFGIQVDSVEAVNEAIARFKAANLAIQEEFNTDCCYALQDKVWVTDPDGNRWEIFVVSVADTAPEITWNDSAEIDRMPVSHGCSVPSCCT